MKRIIYAFFFGLALVTEINPAFAIKDPDDTAPPRVTPPIRVADSISDLPATHSPCLQHLEFPNESSFSLLSIQYQNVLDRFYANGPINNPNMAMSNLLRSYVGDVQDAIRESHLAESQRQYWRTILAAHSLDSNITPQEIRAYIKDLADLNDVLTANSSVNFKIKMFLGPISELAIDNQMIGREDVRNSDQDPAAFESVKKTIEDLKLSKATRDKLSKAIPPNYGKSAELMEEAVINLRKLNVKMPERIAHLIMVLDCRLRTWEDLRSPQVVPTNANQLLVRDLFHEMLIYIHEIENAAKLAANLANSNKSK